MMLHRHFEAEKERNVTTLEDVTPKAKVVSEGSDIGSDEAPKRRGRPRKTED